MKQNWHNNSIVRKIIPAFIAVMCLTVPVHFADASLNPITAVGNWVNDFVFGQSVRMGGIVLLLGAGILDLTISQLVIGMGTFFAPGAGVGEAVKSGWTVIRDLLNMLFIFGLIYIGIKTILESDDSGTRKLLGYLLGAALLINFSLFFTQAIVDASNILATQVYAQFGVRSTPGDGIYTPISGAFMDTVGLTSWLGKGGLKSAEYAASGATMPFMLFGFMILVFFVLAGIAFMLGAIMFVSRFIALIIFMIFSPLMFLGWILPKFQSTTDDWWKKFLNYSFFAPIYLFLIYISLKILKGMVAAGTSVGSSNNFSAGATEKTLSPGFLTTVLGFTMMIGLLWASLKVGSKLSMVGSGMTMNAANHIGRAARGQGARWAMSGYDSIDRRTGGGLTNIGGERVRRQLKTSGDYGYLTTSRDGSEKLRKEGVTRNARRDRLKAISDNIPKNIAGASDAQLLDLLGSSLKSDIVNNAHLLKPSQMEAIMKSDLNDAVKKEINDKRKSNFTDIISKSGPEAKEILEGMKEADIAKLPKEVLTSVYASEHLSTNVLAKILDNNDISAKERALIKQNIFNTYTPGSKEYDRYKDWFDHNTIGQRYEDL